MTFLENFALITMYLCMLTLTVTWTTIILKSLGVNKYALPFIGIFYYLQSFGPDGRIYGPKKVLFAFFMAFYHAILIALCFLPIILTITN